MAETYAREVLRLFEEARQLHNRAEVLQTRALELMKAHSDDAASVCEGAYVETQSASGDYRPLTYCTPEELQNVRASDVDVLIDEPCGLLTVGRRESAQISTLAPNVRSLLFLLIVYRGGYMEVNTLKKLLGSQADESYVYDYKRYLGRVIDCKDIMDALMPRARGGRYTLPRHGFSYTWILPRPSKHDSSLPKPSVIEAMNGRYSCAS